MKRKRKLLLIPDDEAANYYDDPPPLTERDGLRVGDAVILTSLYGAEWPAVIEGFNSLPNDIVVCWTGKRPSLDDRSTISRSHLQSIRRVDAD